jgi:hypothetical protein
MISSPDNACQSISAGGWAGFQPSHSKTLRNIVAPPAMSDWQNGSDWRLANSDFKRQRLVIGMMASVIGD